MIKKSTCLIITFLFSSLIYSQSAEKQSFNLGFEQIKDALPENWQYFGNSEYSIYPDSSTVKSGKYSFVIENQGEASGFKALAFNLPNNYNGKSIRLSGFIKTEGVSEGYAGLWMRIDPQVEFDNMNDRGVTGTTDWKEYEIILPLNPKKTDRIVVGGLLVGKGKMWLDDFKISIDGKDLTDKAVKIYTKQLLPAEKDNAFDNGSNIVLADLDSQAITHLTVLGKLWGFLKYHHPEVGKGNLNWDYELFRMLPDYLKQKNKNERDLFLLNWIEKYGKIPTCEKCRPVDENAFLKPDFDWVDHSDLSDDLKSKIKEIYLNRHQGEHFYIALHPDVNNPDFRNEKAYVTMPYPDAGFRLLSLYRYWNMIHYYFPNKHLTDKKWDTVLQTYLPQFIEAQNELDYELAALQLIGEINDTHANLWGGGDKISEWRGHNYAPFRAEFIEQKYVVTDYYNPEYALEAKVKVGDIITHLNGKSIASVVDSLKAYYPASNEAAMLRDISIDLLRSPQKTLHLDYISEGENRQQTVALYERDKLKMYYWYKVNRDEKCYKMLNGNIGYITLATIKDEDIPVIKEMFKNTKGIIIDIRNYPSTFVPLSLGSLFVNKLTPFVKFSKANPNHPGEFTFREGAKIKGKQYNYKGKLIVLVNQNSQSQAEYTAMAFRAGNNTTILGSTTAGADGNVSQLVLPGGLQSMISGIGVYYPDGTETQRIGIVPDLVVKPTIKGIKEGKDEVLEKAIEILNQ